MKPPPLQGKSPILRGGLAPWDSLPDCRHPVAWAYLARGVLHFIKPPPKRAKPNNYDSLSH
jgi:hypothetical protein